MKRNLRCLLLFLLTLGLTRPALATAPPAASRTLGEILNPDGTLRPGANGSFDARAFRMETMPDGRPVFRPAGTKGAGDEHWQNGFGLPDGPGAMVSAVVRAGTDVYIGGIFNTVGSISANYVAKWNGTRWSALGAGPTAVAGSVVTSLAVAPNGDVYAGGFFNQAGATSSESRVAKWDGSTWRNLGGRFVGTSFSSGLVNALAVAPNGDVYAGGDFVGGTTANGVVVTATYVARWDGTAWNPLGRGVGTNRYLGVYALAVAPNGDLYVGGRFEWAGTVTAIGVAKWNGTAWSSLGTGTGNGAAGYVYALAVAGNGDVYVGGAFSQAGGMAAENVAKWNGTSWSSLGSGISMSVSGVYDHVNALAIDGNGDVYAGGYFDRAGGATVSNLAKWDGTSWSSVGTGLNATVRVLAMIDNDKVCAGGDFTATGDGSKAMNYFGIYDPNAPLLAAKTAKSGPAAQLFPNPAHGAATLRLPASAPRLPLTLTDVQGRTVRRYPAPVAAEAALDLRGLPAGAYVVRCGEYSQRLVVE